MGFDDDFLDDDFLDDDDEDEDKDYGSFEGYGSVFGNKDLGNDVIETGAFAKSLKRKKPHNVKLLYQHKTDMPIGVFDEIKEWINENIEDESKLKVFATGGNINKIQDMTRTKSGKPISYLSIKNLYNNLLEKDITNRMIKYNLNPDRADVIIPALKIFISTMDWANTNKLFVPKVGLVDGMISEIHSSINSVN